MADATTAIDTSAIAAEDLTPEQAQAEFEAMAAAKAPANEVTITEAPATTDATPTPETPKPAAAASAAVEEPKPAAAAPAAAAPDIWATAPAELRSAHEAEVARERQRYTSDLGRQAAHQRRIRELEDQLAQRSTATPAAATTTAPKTSLRENPAIKKTLEELPEVALGPVLDAIDAVDARSESLSRDVSSLTSASHAQFLANQKAALTAAHPDWQHATASQEFADWLAVQPAFVKEAIKRNGADIVDAEEAGNIVGNFKAHYALTHPRTQPTPPAPPAPAPTNLSERRQAQLTAVTTTPKGAPAAVPVGGPAGDDAALFNHFASKKTQRK